MGAHDGGGKTILLVEDEPALRDLMQRYLAGSGFVLMTAAHGEAALALATRSDTTLNLVVTDIVMPCMSGHVLAQRLAEVDPHLRVLFVTGQADTMPAARAGVLQTPHPFLLKPFTAAELVSKVRATLRAPAPRVVLDLPTSSPPRRSAGTSRATERARHPVSDPTSVRRHAAEDLGEPCSLHVASRFGTLRGLPPPSAGSNSATQPGRTTSPPVVAHQAGEPDWLARRVG